MDIDRDAPVQASAEAEIAAPIDLVWEVQADLPRWPEWNADVRKVQIVGAVAPGTAFKWKAGGMNIISELREVNPPRRIGWTGRSMGLRAVHIWSFAETPRGTRVQTEESFDGWLARAFSGLLKRALATSLERGVAALAAECERRAGQGG